MSQAFRWGCKLAASYPSHCTYATLAGSSVIHIIHCVLTVKHG
jgi:hypothetical protein